MEGEKGAALEGLAEGLMRSVNWTTEEASEKFLDACAEDQARREERVAAIKFVAEDKKVQTTTDGGIRLTLDLPEDGREVMADLANCQQNGVYLTIEAIKTE